MTLAWRLSAFYAAVVTLAPSPHARAQAPATETPPAGDSESADTTALAADGCGGERFVVLTFAPDIDGAFAAEVRTDLATELAQRGLSLCSESASPREPAARVALSIDDAVVLVQLDDRLTHKRVARDLPLSALPANGRALATAIAVDELLRASWAELTLRRSPEPRPEPPPPPPPPPVQLTSGPHTGRPVSATSEPLTLRVMLGGDVGYAHTSYRYDALSLHARATLRPGWGWFVLQAGPLSSLRVHTDRGDIIARGVGGALTAGACAQGAPSVFACGGARGGIDFLALRGSDARMAEQRDQNSYVVHASALALIGGTLTSRLSMFGELGVGSVLRGARATDGESRLLAVTGLLLSLHAGLEFEL